MNRPLRILQISAADILGGAERIALQLHRAYRKAGHEAYLAVGERNGPSEPGIIHIDNQSAKNRLACFISRSRRRLRLRIGRENFDHPASRRLFDDLPFVPDVLHLHNLHSPRPYFDLRLLGKISHRYPTVLTLHDAWLTTGHCAHSFDCDRWQIGCGHCPDLTIYPAIRRDATAANWVVKRDIFAASRFYVTTPSDWLMQRIRHSMLWPAVIESRVIPNGVDTGIFKPADKGTARDALGLPLDQAIVIAMTGGKGNQFKDRTTLLAAIDSLAMLMDKPWTMVLLGEEAGKETRGNLTIRSLTSIDQSTVAQYLSAANVLLHAARADTFPNSILEAMACGTPVVATAVGGIPEQIQISNNPTGILTSPGDAGAMAQAAWRLLFDSALQKRMAQNAVAYVQQRFTLDAQVSAMEDFYRLAITNHQPQPTS